MLHYSPPVDGAENNQWKLFTEEKNTWYRSIIRVASWKGGKEVSLCQGETVRRGHVFPHFKTRQSIPHTMWLLWFTGIRRRCLKLLPSHLHACQPVGLEFLLYWIMYGIKHENEDEMVEFHPDTCSTEGAMLAIEHVYKCSLITTMIHANFVPHGLHLRFSSSALCTCTPYFENIAFYMGIAGLLGGVDWVLGGIWLWNQSCPLQSLIGLSQGICHVRRNEYFVSFIAHWSLHTVLKCNSM